MKTIQMWALTALLLAGTSVSCAGERYTDPSKLPAPAKEFLAAHFPGAQVVSVERDDVLGDWETLLKDGTKVDFSRRGNLESVEAPRGKILPADLVEVMPAPVETYLTKEYPAAGLRKISRDGKRWEVELSGVKYELKFDAKGQYLGADD